MLDDAAADPGVINLETSVTPGQPAVMRSDFRRSAVAADRGRHAR
jgi:hypothetical protein